MNKTTIGEIIPRGLQILAISLKILRLVTGELKPFVKILSESIMKISLNLSHSIPDIFIGSHFESAQQHFQFD